MCNTGADLFDDGVLDDPRGPTDHATHDLKLSIRGSRLCCGRRVPQGVTGPFISVQRRYLVLAVSPRVKGVRGSRDPILAALGQEKVFL